MPEIRIRLKHSSRPASALAVLAGFALLILTPITASELTRGNWHILLALTIPIGLVGIGRLLDAFTPADCVVLYPDRMELPRWRRAPRVVRWADVTILAWPKTGNSEAPIVLSTGPGGARQSARTTISLANLALADRLTLVRYLRSTAADLPQENWPRFCRRAVRLVEAIDEAGAAGGTNWPFTIGPPAVRHFLERHPLIAGMIAPVTFLIELSRLVSRQVWWTMAAIIAASGTINIRLVWGQWLSPFTAVVLGGAAVCFGTGLFAPSAARRPQRPEDLSFAAMLPSLIVACIGLPLMANAIVRGWVPLPLAAAKWITLSSFFILLAPGLIHGMRRERRMKHEAPALEAYAMRRWDAYAETGVMPPAAPTPA